MQGGSQQLWAIKDLIPVAAVLVSAAGLLYAWHKDRLLKRREVADRIRRSAATVTAKLERWKQLALRFFDEVQPLITDTDVLAVTKHDVIAARDFWWRSAIAARSQVTRIILDEEIELAYAELYGYDASVRELFTKAIETLRRTDELSFAQLMVQTQRDVLEQKANKAKLRSAQLGNQMRASCAETRETLSTAFESVLLPIRKEMLKLILASDNDLFAKRITLSDWSTVMPHNLEEESWKPDSFYKTLAEVMNDLGKREMSLPCIPFDGKSFSLLRSFARGEDFYERDRLGTLDDERSGGTVDPRRVL